jgi:acetyl-CoA C-acetyltransferase
MPEAWIIDACRTPRGIGKQGKGSLASLHPQRLGAAVLGALAERNNLNTAEVDDIVWGCAAQMGTQSNNMGRMSALDAGYDITSAATMVERFCGSGITATNIAAARIMSGMENLIISGGTELMSLYPSFYKVAPSALHDMGNLHLRALYPMTHQGVAADAIAAKEGIARRALDELGILSQQRADIAIKNGYFDKSMVTVYHDDGSVALDHEEYPRPDSTLERFAGLEPAFGRLADTPVPDQPDHTFKSHLLKAYPDLDIRPVHHVGTSSGVVDGSAAILLASPCYSRGQGWTPRAKVIAMAVTGGCPSLILDAPVDGARKVLAKADLSVDAIDLWEINEAFAVVAEKFIRRLELDRDKVNVNGGAMALGHPVGATGAMLIGMALDELERRDQGRALITMCTGGGMAPAIIIERI